MKMKINDTAFYIVFFSLIGCSSPTSTDSQIPSNESEALASEEAISLLKKEPEFPGCESDEVRNMVKQIHSEKNEYFYNGRGCFFLRGWDTLDKNPATRMTGDLDTCKKIKEPIINIESTIVSLIVKSGNIAPDGYSESCQINTSETKHTNLETGETFTHKGIYKDLCLKIYKADASGQRPYEYKFVKVGLKCD